MSFTSWLTGHFSTVSHRPGRSRLDIRRLFVEGLEERRLLTFLPAVSYPVGTSPQAIVSADFNNDSILDFAVASGTVNVLLGNADGTFQAAISSPSGNRPTSLVVGDFNGDGNLDLVSADNNYINALDAVDVAVLLGNGNGTFGAPTGYEASYGNNNGVLSLAIADFNGDGHLDIAAASYDHQGSSSDSGYVGVLLGTGAGTFGTPQEWSGIGSWATDLIASDFNADGNLDLAAPLAGFVEVALGHGNGMFNGYVYYDTSSNGSSIVAADFNSDGKVDLAATGDSSVSVLLRSVTGGFDTAHTYNADSGPLSDLTTADFNGDGNLDLIASNSSNGTVGVLLGTGAGAFAPPVITAVGTGPTGVAVGDFNGDGWSDAVAVQPASNTISVLLNDGNWTHLPPTPPTLTIQDLTVTEGDAGTVAAVFAVTRDGDLAGTTTVNYSTADGGALADSDYAAASGTVIFGAGESTRTITVLVNGDLTDEYDQAFYVNLNAVSGAVIADGQAFGIIADNDPPPKITITSIVSAKEGNSGGTQLFNFVVTLSAASEKEVRVNFATADGTATTADSDYVARSGTLVFAPGTTSKTISVQVRQDKKKETNETFYVNLSGATNATLATPQGIGEILNDDNR